ncbi:MAG: response regulator [Calditrichaeota bacterium]|nr:response regulator [Calditrichota bacterium]
MKCLIVEDSIIVRRILGSVLKKLGVTHILEAGDGKTAWHYLEREPVDLVITDWNMPEMDGLELVQAIRKHERTSHIPVIMITIRDRQDDVMKAYEYQVNSYIVKPFSLKSLKEKIEQVIKATGEK